MMEEKKKKFNYLKFIIVLLFLIYIVLYILNVTGYYDGNIRKRVEFTKEQMEVFESDVNDGKSVDLNEYLKEQNKNYTNKTSKLGYAISTNTEKLINDGVKEIVKFLSRLFT